jgi:hypothetical protein
MAGGLQHCACQQQSYSVEMKVACDYSYHAYAHSCEIFDTSPFEQRIEKILPFAVNALFTVWNYNYEIVLSHKSLRRKTDTFKSGVHMRYWPIGKPIRV